MCSYLRKKLHLWYGEDQTCALCLTSATLEHIFNGCKISLKQDRYNWRYSQVLKNQAMKARENNHPSLCQRATNSTMAPTSSERQEMPNYPPTKAGIEKC